METIQQLKQDKSKLIDEILSLKTLTCLLLSVSIILIQLFWK